MVTAEGQRWMPQWKTSRRVKVSFEQLRLWYQTLDELIAAKERLETALWQELRDLFSLEPELVFYDITSTYFEGRGPAGLGQFGYSRDGKPRNRQVLVGVVMMDGWPIAHHVFAGNRLDQTTVAEVVVVDLRQRFGLRRVVFVGDRGMVTLKNLEHLRQAEQGYLVGFERRNRKEIPHYIEQAVARQDWQECPVGITASEKSVAPRTWVQEVPGKELGVRVFVVHSEEREQACEGKYVIQTGEQHLTPVEAVMAYKQLNEVERGGRAPEGAAGGPAGASPQGGTRAGARLCGGAGVSAGPGTGEEAARGWKLCGAFPWRWAPEPSCA